MNHLEWVVCSLVDEDNSDVVPRLAADVDTRRRGLHGHLLDGIGQQICDGTLAAGATLTIEDLERTHSISRSVAREAVRVLESMGLVTSRRRVGVVVQPASGWNVFDPQVIRWRLAGEGRAAQLRSLTELRMAAEPEAARLAASRGSLEAASSLVGLSGRLWAAGRAGDLDHFLELDIAFHRLVLESSGNEMLSRMGSIIGEVLIGRTQYGLMPDHPHVEALQLHADVASAIQRGDADAAGQSMRAIMDRTFDEMTPIWVDPGAEAATVQ